MIYNLNADARVTLTRYGEQVLVKHYTDLGLDAEFMTGYNWITGVYEAPLWDIMQIFGRVLYMGNTRIPFEKNVVEITEEETSA